MTWLSFSLFVVGATGGTVLAGGALLWVGGRFLAKSREATFGRCLSTHVGASVAAIIGGLMIGIPFSILPGAWGALVRRIAMAAAGLLILAWLIRARLRLPWGRAMLAWLPTLAQPLVALLLVLPVVVPARRMQRRAECRAQLGRLATAIHRYASRHDGRLPPTLDALGRRLDDGGSPPRCPCAAGRATGGYVYHGRADPPAERPEAGSDDPAPPLTLSHPGLARRIIACDLRCDRHGGGRNVLYGDGWARWLAERQFQAELARPCNAALATALRAAERP